MTTGTATVQKRNKLPKVFWLANSMDIFERFAWFGFWAVSGIYMTGSIANGGLGFTHIERGLIQAVMPFLLYLLPVITGALSDRYGYKRMFLISFLILIPSYYMLGQVHSFWAFFFVFLCVSIGAAIYKPLTVATIGHVADDSNRGIGFGINYTLVNLGATAGIFVAGFVRSISWDMVFIMCAVWLCLNFIPLYFYKEPTHEATSDAKRKLKEVLLDAQEVLGNGRFAFMVVPIILALMVAGGEWISWASFGIFSAIMILGSLLWDKILAKPSTDAPWYKQKTKIGNWPFAVYLLILAAFWTMYNQLFITMPLYIQDYIDTSSVVAWFNNIVLFGFSIGESITTANLGSLSAKLTELSAQFSGNISQEQMATTATALLEIGVKVPAAEITGALQSIANNQANINDIANSWVQQYAQVNPEFLLSINFVSIVLFQILVSLLIDRFDVIKVLVVGCLICTAAWLFGGFAHLFAYAGLFIMLTILVFSFGEMVTSPKANEYVATIAPKNKVCLFMGYYYVCIALGYLFGGLVSGWGYQVFAKEMNQPEIMWLLFAGIGVATAVALIIFNRYVVHHLTTQQQQIKSELA